MPTPPAVSTAFDHIFTAHATSKVPMEFLKATAACESGMNPEARPPGSGSSALGLFQLLKQTVADFNKATGKPYKHSQMVRPSQATEVAAWLIATIVHRLKKFGKLEMDWKNPQYAGLVSLAYTAGSSEVQGVPFLVNVVRDAKKPITVANVVAAAQERFPNSKIYSKDNKGYMSDPALHRHIEKVVGLYLQLGQVKAPLPVSSRTHPNPASVPQKPTKTLPAAPTKVARRPASVRKFERPGLLSKAKNIFKGPAGKAAASVATTVVPGAGAARMAYSAAKVATQARNQGQQAQQGKRTLGRPVGGKWPTPGSPAMVRTTKGQYFVPLKANAPKVPGEKLAPGGQRYAPAKIQKVSAEQFRQNVNTLHQHMVKLYDSVRNSLTTKSAEVDDYKRGLTAFITEWMRFRKEALTKAVSTKMITAYNEFLKGYDDFANAGQSFLESVEHGAKVALLLLGVGAAAGTLLFLRR